LSQMDVSVMDEIRFARLITMRAKRGKGDELMEAFQREVVPTAVKIRGLRRLYLLRQSRKKDEFVIVSLWDRERDAEDYAKSGRDKAYTKKLSGVQAGKERVTKLHVELHAVGASVNR
jgi:heme-degrading monooxygenase HmoA